MKKLFIKPTLILFIFCLFSIAASLSVQAGDPIIIRGVDLHDLSAASKPISLSSRTVPTYAHASVDLTFGPGLTGNIPAQQAFTRAAARWSAVLADPVTLNITVDYESLGAGILGSTNATMLWGGYSEVRDLVANGADSGSSREGLLPQLPTISQYSMYVPSNVPTWGGNASITQANYLALGGYHLVPSDGSITFTSNYSWDFDPSDGISPGTFDFEGAAMHEMGHVLGFTSEVDTVDYYLGQNQTVDPYPTPLDFFRFQTSDLGAGFNFTTTPRVMATGGSQSFYYGDGSIPMSTGVYTGDGRQASHWKDDMNLGIMDPTAAPGEVLSISQNDLIAMDLIGWQVVPEPSAMILLLMAGAMMIAGHAGKRLRK
jgi:hypothetical protein